MTRPACGTTCDGTCGWCRLTAERDAAANEIKHLAHVIAEGQAEVARLREALEVQQGATQMIQGMRNDVENEQDKEIARLNEMVDKLHKSACRAGDERDGLAFANSQLREAVEVALPRFCANTCEHDDNYGSVKHHDMECANIRRLLGQDVGENGQIRDAGEGKRV